MYYDPVKKDVAGLNGSGRSPKALTLDIALASVDASETPTKYKSPLPGSEKNLPPTSIHTVTVPGLIRLWYDSIKLYGSNKFSVPELIAPAIKLARDGFPVAEITSLQWKFGESILKIYDASKPSLSLVVCFTQHDIPTCRE